MPVDERLLGVWLDRAFDAFDTLVKQVSRAAWAFESMSIGDADEGFLELAPCRSCGSRLVPVEYNACPACGTEKVKETDA